MRNSATSTRLWSAPILLFAPVLMAPPPRWCPDCVPVASGTVDDNQVAEHTLTDLTSGTVYLVYGVVESGSLTLGVSGEVSGVSCFSLPDTEACRFTSADGSAVTAKVTGTDDDTDYVVSITEE